MVNTDVLGKTVLEKWYRQKLKSSGFKKELENKQKNRE